MSERKHDWDVVLIGGGIMSATLGALLKRLRPDLRIALYEVADRFAAEASHGWHNAGTGHAGICELSYTPDRGADGEVDVGKAVSIFAEFEKSLQFWASAVRDGMVGAPSTFVNPVPHVSFVAGEDQVGFLRSRFKGLRGHHFFREMELADDPAGVAAMAPLLVEGREGGPVAATRMGGGTDVDFGSLSRQLIDWLGRQPDCRARTRYRVTGLTRIPGGGWNVAGHPAGEGGAVAESVTAGFVFIGAGGGSLRLLQRSGIAEARGYGGIPVGGQWLRCDVQEVVARHHAKVYGAALGAAPTMAVPHLDARVVEGKRSLLFGPFASWTTRFLHVGGSALDLPASVRPGNIVPLLKTGLHNLPLVSYLVRQGLQSMGERMAELRRFYPSAREEDWRLVDAGIRVQAIKDVGGNPGIVHFGTEVLTGGDRSIAALLGASPGASVSVHAMLQLVERCFPDLLEGEPRRRLAQLVPVHGRDIADPSEAGFFDGCHSRARGILGV